MKISIISVYNNETILEKCLLNSLKKQKEDYELILIDNTQGKFKCAADALNFGGNKATGNLLLFVHQDVEFYENNLEDILKYYKNSKNLGIAGVAGTDKNTGIVKSNGIHHIPPENMAPIQFMGIETAQTLDEVLLIIPKEIFNKFKFDSETCDNWHLYGADYCLELMRNNYNILIFPITLYHASNGGSMSIGYYKTLKKILKKYKNDFKYIHTTCLGSHNTQRPLKVDILYFVNNYKIINYLGTNLSKLQFLKKIFKKFTE